MDLIKVLKTVNNINDYISITNDVFRKQETTKIQFNMSTVLCLKKIRSFEIDFFQKYNETGAAFKIVEFMLLTPPSKSWGLLGKELISLLKYWLDALRSRLMPQCPEWWTFLQPILKFIVDIRVKHQTLPNIIVEELAECLLDLARMPKPTAVQKFDVLRCLNLCCADSSREIRFALKNKLDPYFMKLSSYMAGCGHLPTQYSIMETLMRWLLPRQQPAVKQTAADRWFPQDRFTRAAVQVFLERPWQNFFRDARDFLNAQNEANELITSVVCKKLTVGKVAIVTSEQRREAWLDVNSTSKCITVLLDPQMLDALGAANMNSFETLVVANDNTSVAKLYRKALEVQISVTTIIPPYVYPSDIKISGEDNNIVTMTISSRSDMARVHRALRGIFDDKYQILLDLDNLNISPEGRCEDVPKYLPLSEDDTRFSHPVEVKRRKHSDDIVGYIVRPRIQASLRSPSTASTSSLAQLHEKLAALPPYRFDKEPVSVCAQPELSIVTEVSEIDDRSLNSTFKVTHYGVCQKSNNKFQSKKKSQSDGETGQPKAKTKCMSPHIPDENSTSCLLVATIGSADDSIINDTLERISKNKDYNADNIIDLLVQEAMQAKVIDKDAQHDSGIITGNDSKKSLENPNQSFIDKTNTDRAKTGNVGCSSTSTDESNTEVVHETQANYLNINTRHFAKVSEKPTANIINDPFERIADKTVYDEQAVEQFFSQHFVENKEGDIIISPTLARKINETSSDDSEHSFDENNYIITAENLNAENNNFEFDETEVIDCLNSMVDKVCEEFEKCLAKEKDTINIADTLEKEFDKNFKYAIQLDNITQINTFSSTPKRDSSKKSTENKIKPKGIKIKYRVNKNDKDLKQKQVPLKKRKNKLEIEPASKMSTIVEVEERKSKETTPKCPEVVEENICYDTPKIRRKRKLYSPKDEDKVSAEPITEVVCAVHIPETQETGSIILAESKTSKNVTPKNNATCYKDIERVRRQIRHPRIRKSKKIIEASPKTKKMNAIFDNLKEKTDSNEKVVFVDKKDDEELAVFNFTSDSEDEDFKKKKLAIQKRVSTTTLGSGDSFMSTKRGRATKRVNYTEPKVESNTSTDDTKKKPVKPRRKRTGKRDNAKAIKSVEKEIHNELIDERMREAMPEKLDTSIVIENQDKTNVNIDPEPVSVTHEMEPIDDDEDKNARVEITKPVKKAKKAPMKKQSKIIIPVQDENDRTESPLPGLLVETILTNHEDANDSVTASMLEKFKKIYRDGPELQEINTTNTTQNLLSDIDRTHNSVRNDNTVDDFNFHSDINKMPDHDDRETIRSDDTTVTRSTSRYKSSVKLSLKRNKKNRDKQSSQNIPKTTNVEKVLVKSSPVKPANIENRAEYDPSTVTDNVNPTLGQVKEIKQRNSQKSQPRSSQKRANSIEEVIDVAESSKGSKHSEKTIATLGESPITAHGHLDESPPNARFLEKKITGRHMEIQDLNQSIQDYYLKLTQEIDDCCSNRLRKKLSEKKEIKKPYKLRSSSDKGTTSPEEPMRIQSKRKVVDDENESTKSSGSRSPLVVVNRLSSQELYEWFSKPFNSHRVSKDGITSSENNVKSRKKKDNVNVSKDSQPSQKRRSIISPVKMFEEVFPVQKNIGKYNLRSSPKANIRRVNQTSPSSNSSASIETTPRKFDKAVKRKLPVHYEDAKVRKLDNNKRLRSDKTKKTSYVLDSENVETTEFGLDFENVKPKKKVYGNVKTKETDYEFENSKTAKADIEKDFPNTKRNVDFKRLETATSDSLPSISSVNEWFKRNQATQESRNQVTIDDDNLFKKFKDSVDGVMEKVDTTLAEIHETTNRNIVRMLVQNQTELHSLREKRREQLRSTVASLREEMKEQVDLAVAHMMRSMEEKFQELERCSNAMDVEYMDYVRDSSGQVVRQEITQKKALIRLLKEDLNAVIDYMKRSRQYNN